MFYRSLCTSTVGDIYITLMTIRQARLVVFVLSEPWLLAVNSYRMDRCVGGFSSHLDLFI